MLKFKFQLFFVLTCYVFCAVEPIPELQQGEQIVYRSAAEREELYNLPLPQLQELEDYYLTEIYDLKKGIYELVLGRYPHLNTTVDEFNNFQIPGSSFQMRKLRQLESVPQSDFSQAEVFWESVIGKDDTRTEVNDTVLYPYSAIARITYMCGGAQAICTGSFISRNVLITAAHCLAPRKFNCSDYKIAPAYQNGDAPFGTYNVTKIIQSLKWNRTSSDPKVLDSDYGLLIIDEPVGARTGWLSLGINCNDTIIPEMKTAGYPDDFSSGLASVPKPKFDGTTMVTTTCNVTGIDQCQNKKEDGTFTHDCDTAGGQSGAAMWIFIEGDSQSEAVRQIRGIHVRGKGGTETNYGVYMSLNALQWIQLMLLTN